MLTPREWIDRYLSPDSGLEPKHQVEAEHLMKAYATHHITAQKAMLDDALSFVPKTHDLDMACRCRICTLRRNYAALAGKGE